MVNRTKGQVALEHEGAAYTMALDFNALADFEGETGLRALEVLQQPEQMTITQMRALFWAGLRQNHPEITLAEAGRILTNNLDKMGEALSAAFPDAPVGNVQKPARARR